MAIVRANPQSLAQPSQGAIENEALRQQMAQLGGQRQMVGAINQDLGQVTNYLDRMNILNQLGVPQEAAPQAQQLPQQEQPQQVTEEVIDEVLTSGGLVDEQKMAEFEMDTANLTDPEVTSETMVTELAKRSQKLKSQGRDSRDTDELLQLATVAPQQAKLAIGNINQMIQNKAVRNFMARDPKAAKEFLQGIGATGMDGNRIGKARGFIGTPNIIEIDGRNYYSGIYEDAQGNVSTKTIPFEEGATLVSRLGETAQEESERAIEETVSKTRGSEKAKLSIKAADDAINQVTQINQNIATIDEAINALDEGAQVGAMSQYLPSFRASTKRFENAANKMGLDVISSVTFGALSKGELDVAMSTALPKGLNEEETRRYLQDKKAAQSKLRDYFINIANKAVTENKTPAEIVIEAEAARKALESGQPATQTQTQSGKSAAQRLLEAKQKAGVQ